MPAFVEILHPVKIDFTRFFIVRRRDTKSGPAGESFVPFMQIQDSRLHCSSNQATKTSPVIIRIPALIDGLKRGDYRLVSRTDLA